MTSTVQDIKSDLVGALKRADHRYAGRHGDDPAPADYVTALANAAHQVLATAGPGSAVVDTGAERALRADKERLDGVVAELRGLAERADRNAARLRTELDKAPKAADLDAARADAASWHAKHDRVVEQLAALQRDYDEQDISLTSAHAALDELAADHHHTYVLADGAVEPSPCECGQLYPRTNIVVHAEQPAGLDLFEHLRATGWGRKAGAR